MNNAFFIIPKHLCSPLFLKHGLSNCASSFARQASTFRYVTSITYVRRSEKTLEKAACFGPIFEVTRAAFQSIRPLHSTATNLKWNPGTENLPKQKPQKLPQRYFERVKAPFGRISKAELSQIFDCDVDYIEGNEILRMLHERRVNGSLIDKGAQPEVDTSIPPESLLKALEWLRKKYAVDEQEAAQRWAAMQISRVEAKYIEDAERLGIYKPPDGPVARSTSNTSTSVLDEFKEYNVQKRARQMEAQEKSGEAQKSRELAVARQEEKEKKQLESEQRIAKRREERAKKGMVATDGKVDPESPNPRIVRPLAFGIVFVCLVSLAADLYTPVQQPDRLFPDLPVAVATVSAIAAVNFCFYVLWKVPRAWRMMNTYFTQVVAYPFTFSILGNTMSHRGFVHLTSNMVVGLLLFGIDVHEDIGRARFMELYLSGCIMGSLCSLFYHILTRQFSVYTQGASGGVYAILAAWAMINRNKLQTSQDTSAFALDVSRWAIILFFVSAHFLPSVRLEVDWMSHVGGAIAGFVLVWFKGPPNSMKPAKSRDLLSYTREEPGAVNRSNINETT